MADILILEGLGRIYEGMKGLWMFVESLCVLRYTKVNPNVLLYVDELTLSRGTRSYLIPCVEKQHQKSPRVNVSAMCCPQPKGGLALGNPRW